MKYQSLFSGKTKQSISKCGHLKIISQNDMTMQIMND